MSINIDVVKSRDSDDDTYHIVVGNDGSTMQYITTVSVIAKRTTLTAANKYVLELMQSSMRYALKRKLIDWQDITLESLEVLSK
jgi:hypothetical protein